MTLINIIIIIIIMQITKQKLQELYTQNSNKKVCKMLGITNATLVSYLKKNNITLKGRGNRDSKAKVVIKDNNLLG